MTRIIAISGSLAPDSATRKALAVALEIIEQTRHNREACRGVIQKALLQMAF